MLVQLKRSVETFLWHPRFESASYPVVVGVRLSRFLYAIVRDSLEGQITLRAMSLVYTSLLSLVPLIALSFSVLKGFNVHHDIKPLLYQFLAPLGQQGQVLTDNVIGFVDNVKGVALGSAGLLFLLYAVISMVQKVEESLNFVWQVNRARSFGRRFTEYISVIVIAPVLMATALGLLGSLSSTAMAQKLSTMEPFGTTVLLVGALAPYLLVTVVFSFIYAFVPNTRVNTSAALVGGTMAALLWAAISSFFASFVTTATAKYTAIYSTFAIAMLALIWVYINWLILLIGAEISYYYQNPGRLRRGRSRLQLTNRLRERLALTVMYLVGADYRLHAPSWTTNTVAVHLGVPAEIVGSVVADLQKCDLLLATEDEILMPARDMSAITLAEVWSAVRADRDADRQLLALNIEPINKLMDEVENAIKQGASKVTLREFVATGQTPRQESEAPSLVKTSG